MKLEKVRCVHFKTGAVAYNIPLYALDKSWQKLTGFYPQPEPKPEEFKKQESKTKTNNEITETIQSGATGRPATGNTNTKTGDQA